MIKDEKYYMRPNNKGNIFKNRGTLFQLFAFRKSLIDALNGLDITIDEKILDVGCGNGGTLRQLIEFGFKPKNLHGIDTSLERIADCQSRYPNIWLYHGDASKMYCCDDYFDIVLESTLFIELTDDELSQKIANEMVRVCKPNGYILLIDWRYSYFHPNNKALNKKRIKELFGNSTKLIGVKNGALIPQIGYFIANHCYLLYFMVQWLFPELCGQITTVLRKK
jgi:ubiquinone/menaquinone biosynthesis C-methylase UbiE